MSLIGPDELAPLIRAALIAVGDSDPADVTGMRDILWLAAASAARETPDPDQENAGEDTPGHAAETGRATRPDGRTRDEREAREPGSRPEGDPWSPARLFDTDREASDGQAGTVPARRVDLVGPAALRERLELARALRPFRRTVPSRHRHVLDVEATVRASAVTGKTLPILRPAAERRFSADLVFDASPSMQVWEDTFGQLARVFQHAGVFREVRKWNLHTNEAHDEVWLTDRKHDRRPPAALRSADRRRVVLTMTDGVAEHWYTPHIWECLNDWGEGGPTALIDPLPVKLWNLSAIGPSRVRVRASSSGAPNADLRYKQPRFLTRAGRPAARAVPVPVTEFSPSALMAWASTVADAHPDGCVAVLTGPRSRRSLSSLWPSDADAEGSLSNFVRTASPAALRLAVLAAASEARDLAVLRAIQEEMLPGSATSDLAEVLVSGIYWRVPGHDDETALRFRMDPACRARLQERASAQDDWDVYRAVSAAFARRYPDSASGFRAAVLDPSGDAAIRGEQLAFAEVARSALARARQGSQPAPPAVRPPAPTVRLFLSYAEEDSAIAREVASALAERGIGVFLWQDLPARTGRLTEQIGEEMAEADAFLALLSPSYLASPWCAREHELALQQEAERFDGGRGTPFIHVLRVSETPHVGGFLRSYKWSDLTGGHDRASVLDELARRLLAYAAGREGLGPGRAPAVRIPPRFRDRRYELDIVLRGLGDQAGPAFWLVVAPPQLGKSWFLQEVGAQLQESQPDRWVVRLVDLRDHADVRDDAMNLLRWIFGVEAASETTESGTIRDIAIQILRTGRPHLYLLDSAELLVPETVRELRSFIGEIHRLVLDANPRDARLGLIVASRSDTNWRGVTPVPRFSLLPLTELPVNVTEQALADLALGMSRAFSAAHLRMTAEVVQGLTEGLPALLVPSLQWIGAEEWLDMDRLKGRRVFEELVSPYIRDTLLAKDSLLPGDAGRDDAPRHVLDQALRLIVPYRLFTLSHLRLHLERESALGATLGGLGWSLEDLWRAINDIALLTRPLDEPWLEINGAIRRLLFRYYYLSDEDRAAAQREAAAFVAVWGSAQSGKEQVLALIEQLWHQAMVLCLTGGSEMEPEIIASARRLSTGLRESPAYTAAELREYAVRRMHEDEEFRETVSSIRGLFDRLTQTVADPSSKER